MASGHHQDWIGNRAMYALANGALVKLGRPIPRSVDKNDYGNNHNESTMSGLEVERRKRPKTEGCGEGLWMSCAPLGEKGLK